jgi:methyl-accepting chemotaxis protein
MGRRVALLCAISLVPSLVLLYLLVREKNLAIDFARDERVGTRYFVASLPLREALAAEAPDPEKVAQALENLRSEDKADGAYLGVQPKFSALEAAALGPGAAGAREAYRDLAAEVGDKSKLILDPDLDSFYTMDAVVVEFPLVLDLLSSCRDLLKKALSRPLQAKEAFQLNAWVEELESNRSTVERNFGVAFAQEGGAQSKKRISAEAATYMAAHQGFKQMANAFLSTRSASSAKEALLVLQGTQGATFDFWKAGLKELDWLLKRRIGGFDQSKVTAVLGSGLVAALALLIAWGVAKSLVDPVRRLAEHMRVVVETGDLRQLPEAEGQDEVAELGKALGALMERLKRVPVELGRSAELLSQAVTSLELATTEQNSTITRQATALQETQVTAEEIKQTSQTAARTAQGILEATQKADEIGRRGEESVEQSLEALGEMRAQVSETAGRIGELGQRTRQIGDITNTVKELADQSNMLALNAAIEAVRAGEHGKGFSLVAREIRRLADQSIQATSRVREILEGVSAASAAAVKNTESGSGRIEVGLSQAKKSGENLKALAAMVRDYSASVRQIATAVNQQNTGVTQVFSAVTDQSRMMEETVKQLDNTLKNVATLKQVSKNVLEVVGSYKV